MYLYKNNKRIFIILCIVIVYATVFIIISYTYFGQTANQIQQLAINDLKTNSEIEAHSISNILSNALYTINSNLQVLANAPSMDNQNMTEIQSLLDVAQNSTGYLTDGYYLLNQTGNVVTYSNMNSFPDYKGVDLSHRDYFQVPIQNQTRYVSTVLDSNDNIPRMYVSLPINVFNQTDVSNNAGENMTFSKGVVVASIAATSLGDFLQIQIHPKFTGSLGFIDREGNILYSQNESYIGKNFFGNKFQSDLDVTLGNSKNKFNNIINKSLFLPGGLDEFSFENFTTTIAYQTVTINPTNTNNNNDNDSNNVDRIGTLFTITPHTLAEDVLHLISIQETLNFLIILAIVIVTLFAVILIVRWNKTLQKIVNQRTHQLKATIQKLKESSEKLNLTKVSLEKSNNEIIITNAKLRTVNEELKLHTKRQKEFINVAAHELRTPIQAIIGNLELIEMFFIPSLLQTPIKRSNTMINEIESLFKNKERIYEFSEKLVSIYRNSERLEKLVYNLLDISRIEMNKLVIYKEHFNLNEKISNVIKDITNRFSILTDNGSKQKTDIIFNTPQDPITVYVDKIRIYEVISNLLINAIKFSDVDHKSGITVSVLILDEYNIQDQDVQTYIKGSPVADILAKSKKSVVLVSIKDRGKGIDEKMLPKLFTKFTTDSTFGTGLGLYIAKNIVETHDGKIWAQNNDDGPGATFSFILPLSNK